MREWPETSEAPYWSIERIVTNPESKHVHWKLGKYAAIPQGLCSFPSALGSCSEEAH